MEETSPKPFVLVLMPFNEAFQDIYEVGIKVACRDAGAYCERVDEQMFEGSILDRIYHQIRAADIIVADMTGKNANVFYEVGYAHCLNKRVLLLTQRTDDIPFDMKHYPHIVYGDSISVLKRDLEARVRWAIDNPKQSLASAEAKPDLYINGKPHTEAPVVSFTRAPNAYAERSLRVQLDLHNPTAKLLTPDSYTIALIAPRNVSVSEKGKVVSMSRLPDGRQILTFEKIEALFPDAWSALWLMLSPNDARDDLAMCVRVFTEVGTQDLPFTVRQNEAKPQAARWVPNGVGVPSS